MNSLHSGDRRDRATRLALRTASRRNPASLVPHGHRLSNGVFSHPEEAQRARSGLLQHQVSQEDIRLYESQEILRILARAQAQRSILAKAVFALAADSSARQGVLDNAHTGGAALWLVAPTRDRANYLVALLADYSYSSCATTPKTAWPTSSRMPTDTISLP
jgi:hypothetical protein